MLVTHVVGARPNFMKAAPVLAALGARTVSQRLVHTGQHYDHNMSEVFFDELGLPRPDVNLGVGSSAHATQTAQMMVALDGEFAAHRPDLLLVYGDINSTVAASLVAAKLGIAVGHVEAGLRSRDREMPEEVNRLVTDRLATLLFTPSVDGNENLAREGADLDGVHFVGNVMIDTLVRLRTLAEKRWPSLSDRLDVQAEGYALVTLHRPRTVDVERTLVRVMEALSEVSSRLPVVFPVHPRTRARLEAAAVEVPESLRLVEPVGYLDFLALQDHARLVVTDSGGVQEETTFLGVPCFTIRPNTERPVTISAGTNELVGFDMERLVDRVDAVLGGEGKRGAVPPLWDGRAGERIADVVVSWLDESRG